MTKGMSQAELGRHLGLSPAAITKLKGQGMPVHSVEAAQAWREDRQNVAQRKPLPEPAARPWAPWPDKPAEPPRIEVGGQPVFGGAESMGFPDEDRDSARTRREISEANIAEMSEARLRRELIRVEAVQRQMATDFATTRDALLQIPARMGPILAAQSEAAEVQTLLHAEIHQALVDLSGSSEQLPKIEGAFD